MRCSDYSRAKIRKIEKRYRKKEAKNSLCKIFLNAGVAMHKLSVTVSK